MYTFQRNDEVILISPSEIQLNLHITVDKLETSWVAKVPALNTVAYIDREEDIEETVNASVASFFNYWAKQQGQSAFFEHLKSLGFTLAVDKKFAGKIIPRKSVRDISMKLAI